MSLSVHMIQAEQIRALQGTPAATDPAIDAVVLHGILEKTELAVANATLSQTQIEVLRTHLAPNATVAASVNAHAWPKGIGPTNPWMNVYRSRTKEFIQEDAFPEYRLGLAAVEGVVAVTEELVPRWFDVIYWDELWASMPTWMRQQWATHGVTAGAAWLRWQSCRDHFLRSTTRPFVANVGGTMIPDGFRKGAVSVEAQHDTPVAIVDVLVQFRNPLCTCWPEDAPWRHGTYQYGPLEVEGRILCGVMLAR